MLPPSLTLEDIKPVSFQPLFVERSELESKQASQVFCEAVRCDGTSQPPRRACCCAHVLLCIPRGRSSRPFRHGIRRGHCPCSTQRVPCLQPCCIFYVAMRPVVCQYRFVLLRGSAGHVQLAVLAAQVAVPLVSALVALLSEAIMPRQLQPNAAEAETAEVQLAMRARAGLVGLIEVVGSSAADIVRITPAAKPKVSLCSCACHAHALRFAMTGKLPLMSI